MIRFILGSMGVVMTGLLLYGLWRLYAFIYMDGPKKKPKADVSAPQIPKERYSAPKYLYDTGTHEFFVQSK